MKLAKIAGRFALFLVGMSLLTIVSLFVIGAYLTTWPIMRKSPKDRRLTALVDLATSGFGVIQAYGMERFTEPATKDTEDTEVAETYPRFDGGHIVIGPGCFASDDGSVLNWDGRNYIPQHDVAEGGD